MKKKYCSTYKISILSNKSFFDSIEIDSSFIFPKKCYCGHEQSNHIFYNKKCKFKSICYCGGYSV